MTKKLLIVLFYICSYLSIEIVSAAQKPDRCVIVFDFGGVIAQANTAQMTDFLMQSFKINKVELSNALKEMQSFIAKGGSEKQFWEQFALSQGVTLADHWFDQFGVIIKKSITEIPETLLIVKALQKQGYQTAMLSDVTQYQAEIVRKMGYYDLFNPVLLSYEIGVKKPHPEAFKILLEKLQVPAAHVLFIDDRIENVEAAKNLGIDSIQFINPEQLKKELEKRGIYLSQNDFSHRFSHRIDNTIMPMAGNDSIACALALNFHQ